MAQSPLRKLSAKDGLGDSSLLQTLIDSLPERVYVKDTEGRYILSNLAHARALGSPSPEETAGKSDSDFYPKELAERYRADEQEVLRSGRPLVEREEPGVDGRGNERCYSTTKVPMRDDSGEIVGLVGIIRDITERKEAERALRESEDRFRNLSDATFEGIAIIEDGEVLETNRAFAEMYGYDLSEVRGMSALEFHVPEVHNEVWQKISSGYSEPYESIGLRKDGTTFDVEIRGETAWHGGRSFCVTAVRDVTERKRAEEKIRQREQRFRSLIQNASDVITIVEADGTVCYESPTVERVLGYSPGERIGKNAFDYLHPDEEERVKETFAEALKNPGQAQRPVELRLRHKDGSWRRMETTRTNLLDDPAVKGVVANSRDVTERKRAEEALRESEERFRTAFEDAPIGVALVGLDRSHLRVNRAYCEMLGYTEEELLAKSHPEIICRDDQEESAARIHRMLEEEAEPYALERRYLHADGRLVWSLSNISLIRDSEGEPSHFVCLHEDITERKELEERLRHQAYYDALTELPNRVLFLDRLDRALARAQGEDGLVAVLLVDLDDFKVVNDSLGHDAGNTVLIEFAERLRRAVRPEDTVGRIFGDEFAILLEASAGVEEANLVTQRIEERLREPFETEGQKVYVSASIGIVFGETAEDRPEEILQRADLAMYEAKRNGKAQHEVYDPGMSSRAVERMNMERDLRRAVEREEFEVYYQPKVSLGTGEITGAEALVRWRHPDRGLLSANQFIPLAEETGLIDQIGLWVLRKSCRQLKGWQEQYSANLELPFGLCVNLSAREIQQPDLAEKVADVLRETGLAPRSLVLEVSERTAMEDAEQTIVKLRQLRDLGVKLAIDDFGTGYCSLVYLEHSLLDVLKIDRVLIHREREDPEECATIISAMTHMAHSLGLTVVVEGIEEEWQLAKLKEMGCEMAQGYYFAKPLPSEALETLLREGVSS